MAHTSERKNIGDVTGAHINQGFEPDHDPEAEVNFYNIRSGPEKTDDSLQPWSIFSVKESQRPRYLTHRYIQNNLRKVAFFVIYCVINIALFMFSAIRYRKENWCIIIARGNGMCLNFNCAFTLVLVLRRWITRLRSTFLVWLLPLDHHIFFHKLVGVMIVIFSIAHSLAHVGNVVILVEGGSNWTIPEYIFTTKPDLGWVWGFAPLSGVLLDVLLLIMVVFSLNIVRRSGHFQLFYWTHTLYLPFWILCILHAPIFWYFLIVPGILFVFERLARLPFILNGRHGKVFIEEVNLLPSKVTHLVIRRPSNFRFHPGDHIYICIPAIAKYEWHPFAISSAPEMKAFLWLHVRSVGHWTNKLYEFLESYNSLDVNKSGNKDDVEDEITARRKSHAERSGTKRNETSYTGSGRERSFSVISLSTFKHMASLAKEGNNDVILDEHGEDVDYSVDKIKKIVKIRVYLDGPYGASSRRIFAAEHAVLIAAGIGVTPFASILQSIMYRMQSQREKQTRGTSQNSHGIMKLKTVDFIWINRDPVCFEWFVSLLMQLESQQENDAGENIIRIHLYFTSATKHSGREQTSGDVMFTSNKQVATNLTKRDKRRYSIAQVALDMPEAHPNEQRYVITGLKTATQAGRPDWDTVFANLPSKRKGKTKVFFCGAPALGAFLKKQCEKYDIPFTKEHSHAS